MAFIFKIVNYSGGFSICIRRHWRVKTKLQKDCDKSVSCKRSFKASSLHKSTSEDPLLPSCLWGFSLFCNVMFT